VSSLDQLYAHACAADPLLRRKVQEYARESNGALPVETQEGEVLVRWEELEGDEGMRARVKWGHVKSPDRAVEKLLRVYHLEVPLVLDMCRQLIVFHTVNDLAACLQVMLDDPEVCVLRVKNRLRQDYNPALTAGYRDVSVNLRLDTPQAAALGVVGHVCELQLQLKEFALLRNQEGHARYINYRNARGE